MEEEAQSSIICRLVQTKRQTLGRTSAPGGRISKATANVQLTSALLKTSLALTLTKDEIRLEDALRSSSK